MTWKQATSRNRKRKFHCPLGCQYSSGAHDRNKYTRGNNKILNKIYGLYNIHGNSIW